MVLPASFKQFSTVQMFALTTLLACAFGAWVSAGLAGKSLAICIFGYCAGVGFSFFSDALDDSEMDDRIAISKLFSTIGAMLIFFSFMFGVSIFLAIVLYVTVKS